MSAFLFLSSRIGTHGSRMFVIQSTWHVVGTKSMCVSDSAEHSRIDSHGKHPSLSQQDSQLHPLLKSPWAREGDPCWSLTSLTEGSERPNGNRLWLTIIFGVRCIRMYSKEIEMPRKGIFSLQAMEKVGYRVVRKEWKCQKFLGRRKGSPKKQQQLRTLYRMWRLGGAQSEEERWAGFKGKLPRTVGPLEITASCASEPVGNFQKAAVACAVKCLHPFSLNWKCQ